MEWNFTAECVSSIILCIIWVYSRRSHPLPTLRNRIFNLCFLITFCAMISNILSTLAIYNYQNVPPILTWFITSFYFITTPLMGAFYFNYVVANLYEDEKRALHIILWNLIPPLLYLGLVIANPISHSLFFFNQGGQYLHGPIISLTYIIFYFYCILSVVFVILKRHNVEKTTRRLLMTFPAIATVVIFFQQLFPEIILSGSAATCSLLMIYLYLHNKQLSLDYLTELGNRRECLKRISLQIEKGHRAPFSLAVLSLRGFKHINNKWGQQTGDSYLKAIAHDLQTATDPRFVYRFNGDEFAIVMQGVDENAMNNFLNGIRTRMAEPWHTDKGSCLISSVIGVIRYPDDATSTEEIVDGVEYAVLIAKQSKSDTVFRCTQDTMSIIHRKRQIVEILQSSLKHDEFEVYFQPIYSVKNRRFTSAESLLRLNHTPLGSISPGEFIPIAEDTGQIIDITYLVLRKVCKFIRSLRDHGIPVDGISINLSAVQFTQKDLVSRLTEIIADYGIPFSTIKIEITESTLAENAEVVEDFIAQMHERGIRIAMDDFGTGYSNLRSVIETPLDIVKFDRSLLCAAIENEKAKNVIQSLVRTFQRMDACIVIEGVETQEQAAFAKEVGFDLIQGFFFAVPMPQEAAETYFGTTSDWPPSPVSEKH